MRQSYGVYGRKQPQYGCDIPNVKVQESRVVNFRINEEADEKRAEQQVRKHIC